MNEKSSNQPQRKSRAQPGNKNGTKLKDPDVRQEAFRQYCNHLAAGYPKEAFFFDHPVHSVTWETMDRYISENPTEFPPLLIKRAKAARFKLWFDRGIDLMEGKYRNGSPVVWQNIMRNSFKAEGWDRDQITQDNKSHVEQLAQSIRSDPLSQAEAGDRPGE